MADIPRSEHLLPETSTTLEKALSAADHRLLSTPHNVIRQAWDPDTCPEHLLPYLAVAWSVDEWDPEWPEATKRAVIKASPEIHRLKGTKGALRRAIAALGMGATVEEWFEYSGQPYRFRLVVELGAAATWTARQARSLYRVALATKNVRSWLETIRVVHQPPAPTPLHVGVGINATIRIGNYIGPLTEITPVNGRVYVGVAQLATIRIGNVIT